MAACGTVYLNRDQKIFAVLEDVRGTLKFPTTDDTIIGAGYASINQNPTFANSEETIQSRNILSRFRNMTPAGEWTIPSYLRPDGINTTVGKVKDPQGAVMYEALFGARTIAQTTLGAELGTAATTATVVSTKGFPESGNLLVLGELITYSGKTATTFTNLVRGVGATDDGTRANGSVVYHSYVATTVGVELSAVATTLTVVSTTGFPSTGILRIGTELIQYTGTTATTFTGLVRGYGGTTAAVHIVTYPVGLGHLQFFQTLCKPSMSIWMQRGQATFFARGATVSTNTINFSNQGGVMSEMSGGFMEMGWAGRSNIVTFTQKSVTQDVPTAVTVSGTSSGTSSTTITATGHSVLAGQYVTIASTDSAVHDGTFEVLSVTENSITVDVANGAGNDYGAQGTVTRHTSFADDLGGGLVGIPVAAHGLVAGQYVTLSGFNNAGYNDTFLLPAQTLGSANVLVITETHVVEIFDDNTEKVDAGNYAVGATAIRVDDPKLYTVNSRIMNTTRNDTNGVLGYTISAVNDTTGMLTLSNATDGNFDVVWQPGDQIDGYLPSQQILGTVTESRNTTIVLDDDPTVKIRTFDLTIEDPIQYLEDEISTDDFVSEYVEGERNISGSMNMYFRRAELARFRDGYANTNINTSIVVGSGAGYVTEVELPKTNFEVPQMEDADPAIALGIAFTALGTSGEDSCTITFT